MPEAKPVKLTICPHCFRPRESRLRKCPYEDCAAVLNTSVPVDSPYPVSNDGWFLDWVYYIRAIPTWENEGGSVL